MKRMNLKWTGLLIGAVLVAGTVYALGCFHGKGDSHVVPAVSEGPGKNGQQIAQFKDTSIGLDFTYRTSPDGYVVVEPDVREQAPDAPVKVLTIFRTSDYEDLMRDKGVPRDGPENINIQVFNPGPNIAPNEWAAQHPARSNLQKDSVITWSTIDGNGAARYSWDGLYQGQTVVIARKGWVYMLTVSYSGPGMLKDFNELLSTLKLQR